LDDDPVRKNIKTAPLGVFEEGPGASLRNRVALFLGAASITEIRGLQVSVQQDTVVLQGRVHTFYHKQMAQEFTKRVAGVRNVRNLVEVADGPWPVRQQPEMEERKPEETKLEEISCPAF